ncbi:hypothetical protein [Pontivivens ytuae]|uniref:Uncharacterized protein n=1 Tax=Pontivivens ytuae TaxID=2789856 RepID=A0A7S9LP09_9RHOB|nr:hypothetical protein [Pontivivens ytuae]QPH52603.1 hypothetical protein I0K15_12340 [Pontivivens ytuae]
MVEEVSAKRKVRFLTAVWGERYVREFASLSLPSFLAPGNLPALVREVDLEVVIMTTQSSSEAFDREPAVRRLRETAPCRFIFIDDLVTNGLYGVTLTLAYARGIMDAGAAQTDTWFVFMNSDFVLADGSLRSLLPHLGVEPGAIMSASLRAKAERVVPLLDSYRCQGETILSLSSREGVRLALEHPHRTVVAKTLSQSAITSSTHNQLYWRVDDQTLLARNHLIFMLAIRPEVPLAPISSYCDYGFTPAMVPSGRIDVIDDSDTFFMLELQPSQQEAEMVSWGKADTSRIVKQLESWTTREHRLCARCDVVFHSGEVPTGLDDVRTEAKAFVDALHARMRDPLPAEHHAQWVLGVEAWRDLMERSTWQGRKNHIEPEELGAMPVAGTADKIKGGRFPTLVRYLTRFVRSQIYRVLRTGPPYPLWHLGYQARRLFRIWRESSVDPNGANTCVMWSRSDVLDGNIRSWASAVAASSGAKMFYIDELAADLLEKTFHEILVITNISGSDYIFSQAEHLLKALVNGGRLSIFIEHSQLGMSQADLARRVLDYLLDDAGDLLKYGEVETHFVGSDLLSSMSRVQKVAARTVFVDGSSSLLKSLLGIVTGAAATLFILGANLLQPATGTAQRAGASAMLVNIRTPARTSVRLDKSKAA